MAGIPYVSDPLQMLWQFQQDQARTDLLNSQRRLTDVNTQEQQIKNLLTGQQIQSSNLLRNAMNDESASAATMPIQTPTAPRMVGAPQMGGPGGDDSNGPAPQPVARQTAPSPMSQIEQAEQGLAAMAQTAARYDQLSKTPGIRYEDAMALFNKAQDVRKTMQDDRIKLVAEKSKQLSDIGAIAGAAADPKIGRTVEALQMALRGIAAIDPRAVAQLPVDIDPATGQIAPTDKTFNALQLLAQSSMKAAEQATANNQVATLQQRKIRDDEIARANKEREKNADIRTSIYRDAVNAMMKNADTNAARLTQTGTPPTGTLDENTAKFAAETFLKTGVLPNLGYGKAGAANRQQVLAVAAQLAKEQGMSGTDVAAARGGFRADTASLTQATKSLDAITAFSNTAIKNGDVLVKMAQDVDATGIPVIERWIRAGRQATGDPKVAAFNAQMRVYIPEVAKILTNPNLTGQLTDTARKEIETVVSGGASAQQILAIHNTLKTDFANRENAMKAQLEEIKKRMGEKKSAPAGPKQITGAEDYNALPIGAVYIDPNGVQRTKQQ